MTAIGGAIRRCCCFGGARLALLLSRAWKTWEGQGIGFTDPKSRAYNWIGLYSLDQFLSFGSAAPFISKAPHGLSALPTSSSSACGESETWSKTFLCLALASPASPRRLRSCLAPQQAPLSV